MSPFRIKNSYYFQTFLLFSFLTSCGKHFNADKPNENNSIFTQPTPKLRLVTSMATPNWINKGNLFSKHTLTAFFQKPIICEFITQETIEEYRNVNNIDNIIWATGFKLDFSWIDFPIFRKDGYPTHKRGETQIKGLYFLGFSRLYWERKNFILGAKKEAEYIYKKIIQN